jgi:protein MAK11
VTGTENPVLAASTEDGRILFWSTTHTEPSLQSAKPGQNGNGGSYLPSCVFIGQLGGQDGELSRRIKDFQLIPVVNEQDTTRSQSLIVTTAGSDGFVRLWVVNLEELISSNPENKTTDDAQEKSNGMVSNVRIGSQSPRQVGRLIGSYDTNNRITCLVGFLLTGEIEDLEALRHKELGEENRYEDNEDDQDIEDSEEEGEKGQDSDDSKVDEE